MLASDATTAPVTRPSRHAVEGRGVIRAAWRTRIGPRVSQYRDGYRGCGATTAYDGPMKRSPCVAKHAALADTASPQHSTVRPNGTSRSRSGAATSRSPRRTPRPSWPGRTPQSFDSRSTHSWGQVCGHLGAAWWTESGRTGVPARCPPHTPDGPRIRARPDHALHTSPGRPTSTDTGAPQRPQDLLSLLFFFSSENYRRPGLGNVRGHSPAQGRSVGPPCQALP
jgi:hypothetical protein